ncbi:hypothetical protein [Leptolyngbya sp. PCC 6406]|uniref:hypothetical protein n=1 Tax=Leptolyngbya sp. PCC 6406 TaxID=1173264 RepID=UPI0002E16DF0|nr:hypothetical protein [Leptolyngbya sp. PCC 6406]
MSRPHRQGQGPAPPVRLFEHLQPPTSEQAIWLEALLAEDGEQVAPEEKTVRQQAIAMLAKMLTEDDWQAFATILHSAG